MSRSTPWTSEEEKVQASARNNDLPLASRVFEKTPWSALTNQVHSNVN
jgi:hypothetical protein